MSSRRTAIKNGVEKRLGGFRARLDEFVAEGRSRDAVNMAYGVLVEALTAQSNAAYGKRSEAVDPE